MTTLVVSRCSRHGAYVLTLVTRDLSVRLVPSAMPGCRSCGAWDQVSAWQVSSQELREIINELECAIDEDTY